MHILLTRFVDRDMFMHYQGGGVGHKISHKWDGFLQSDGAQMMNEEAEEEEEGEIEADEDDPDRIEADEGEELDDDFLVAEGYGTL
jgi:hypothetical protein